MPNPTEEQKAIISHRGNAVVSAKPGSGKTFTMARMISEHSAGLLSYQGVIAISYTRKASAELEERCRLLGVNAGKSFFGTIDGFCLGEIVAPFASHALLRKVDINVIENCEGHPEIAELDRPWVDRRKDRWDVVQRALSLGVLPVSSLSEAALCMVRHIPSVKTYLACRYTGVFIDEYQDCGLAQHLLMLELVSLGIRGVAFGDLDQAIFSYDRRYPEFFKELISSSSFKTFYLTKNHRCHESIVDYSLKLIGDKTERMAAEEKRVILVRVAGDEGAIAAGVERYIDRIMERYGISACNEIAMLSTSNRMLSRYKGLLGVPAKQYCDTKLDHGFSKWRAFFRDLLIFLYLGDEYSSAFIGRYISQDLHPRSHRIASGVLENLIGLPDADWAGNAESMVCLAESCLPDCRDDAAVSDLHEALCNLERLRGAYRPADPEEINLLTYHKSKGLEFDAVFCLDCYEYLMPPARYWENTYDAFTQSLNMHYVGITRARKVCYIPIATTRHNARGVKHKTIPSQFLSKSGLPESRKEVNW